MVLVAILVYFSTKIWTRIGTKIGDKDKDPNALAALVNKIEFWRMAATIRSLGRARCEPCSYFALPKLGVVADLAIFYRLNSIVLSFVLVAGCHGVHGDSPAFIFWLMSVGRTFRLVQNTTVLG